MCQRLAFCFLLLASSPACADDWSGSAAFIAEFLIALPSSLLFVSINTAWVICRPLSVKSASVLALLSLLAPLAAIWLGYHDVSDAGSRTTIVVVNCMAATVALLPLAISAVREWTRRRRAFGGETLSGPASMTSPASTRMATALGWILLATGSAMGVFVLRQGLVGYLADREHWQSFATVVVLAECMAFAAPPAIIGVALLLRGRMTRVDVPHLPPR